MLEEAVDVIRQLWTGELISYEGTHYTVDRARIYTRPDEPPPIIVSAFHEAALDLAARIGDGFATTRPDAESRQGDRDRAGKGPTQGAFKCCYGPDREQALETAHRLWANEELTGTLAQVLSTPEEFEAASQLVTPAMVAKTVPWDPIPMSTSLGCRSTSTPASTRSSSGTSAPGTTRSWTSTRARSCRMWRTWARQPRPGSSSSSGYAASPTAIAAETCEA